MLQSKSFEVPRQEARPFVPVGLGSESMREAAGQGVNDAALPKVGTKGAASAQSQHLNVHSGGYRAVHGYDPHGQSSGQPIVRHQRIPES